MSGRSKQPRYLMTVSGGLVRHLGLQMYAGAVPAIAELISNAWDAMARNVWITIPLDKPIEDEDEIIVEDDGHGLTNKECNRAYLPIGRDRRAEEGDRSRSYGRMRSRRLQSRKGIGKLSGFGIANRIEVWTAANGEVCHFGMDYDAIVRGRDFVHTGGYEPEELEDDGAATDDAPGTIITLAQLKVTRAIPKDQFFRSMTRRFAILGSNFAVHINGESLKREEIPFQFRYPQRRNGWTSEELPDGKQVKWWAGFTKTPIQQEEARGFVVYVRGKLAQTPWFFDLSGGAWGQHGLQYLTGEVTADFLDETEGSDLISTDRGNVRWEDPIAQPTKEWGQKLVKRLLEEWADKRRVKKVQDPQVSRFLTLSQRLPDRERRIFKAFVDRITSIPQIDKDPKGNDILVELVEFGFNALTNRSFLDLIRQINAVSPDQREKLADALSEWDIIEAITVAQLVKGRVEIIRKFRSMIGARAREKPDLQEYLKKHPWLIDPSWAMLSHEETLDNTICRHYKLPKTGSVKGRKRLDFFCLGDHYKVANVIDVKRPGRAVPKRELDSLRDYVLFLREHAQNSSTAEKYRRSNINGLLICSSISKDANELAKTYQQGGVFEIRTWDNLLLTSEQLHHEFLNVVAKRAPKDDPRIAEIGGPRKRSTQKGGIKGSRQRKKRSKKARRR